MDTNPSDSLETHELLERVAGGETTAVDELLAQHRPYLQQMIGVRLDPRLKTRVDPSDIVQDAQQEAVRRLPVYLKQRPMCFRLWLRQIAYDRLLMARRKHVGAAQRTIEREMPLPEHSSEQLALKLLARTPTPSEELTREELARRVQQALALLAEADREVLLLRNYEGLNNQETAQVLGIQPGAASQRYGRALLRLRKLLIDSGMCEDESHE